MATPLKQHTANLLAILFFVATTLTVSGCGSSNSGNSTSPSGQNTAQNAWSSVDKQGLVVGSSYDQFQVINLDVPNMLITFALPLPTAPTGGAIVEASIVEIPGATVSIAPDASGMWVASFTMPISYLVKGVTYQNPGVLPNGQPLPGLAGQSLPMLNLHVKNSTFNFYIWGNNQAFAVFVPVNNFEQDVTLVFPIQNKTKSNTLGYFGIVQKVGTSAGGFYGALIFSKQLQQALSTVP